MAMIRAILTGERDSLKLAQMKHPRVKATTEQIVTALEGDYRAERLFALQTAVELYDRISWLSSSCALLFAQSFAQFHRPRGPSGSRSLSFAFWISASRLSAVRKISTAAADACCWISSTNGSGSCALSRCSSFDKSTVLNS